MAFVQSQGTAPRAGAEGKPAAAGPAAAGPAADDGPAEERPSIWTPGGEV
jgi:hypothetical protein